MTAPTLFPLGMEGFKNGREVTDWLRLDHTVGGLNAINICKPHFISFSMNYILWRSPNPQGKSRTYINWLSKDDCRLLVIDLFHNPTNLMQQRLNRLCRWPSNLFENQVTISSMLSSPVSSSHLDQPTLKQPHLSKDRFKDLVSNTSWRAKLGNAARVIRTHIPSLRPPTGKGRRKARRLQNSGPQRNTMSSVRGFPSLMIHNPPEVILQATQLLEPLGMHRRKSMKVGLNIVRAPSLDRGMSAYNTAGFCLLSRPFMAGTQWSCSATWALCSRCCHKVAY